MLQIDTLLKEAVDKKSSDLHITVGRVPMIRKNGSIIGLEQYPVLTPCDTKSLVEQMLIGEKKYLLERDGDVDFSYILPGVGRFRVNAYKQRGSYTLAIRILISEIPTMEQLGLPESLRQMASKQRGLILITGPTGSGKSTTLAAMINHINQTRKGHILTIEDPIEYLHKHNQCIVNQREIGEDVVSFNRALRSALREDPDVILLGEMRDLETIQAAVTAAETGHLVLSTLHTKGAAATVERIIDIFPSNQQHQIRVQLAGILEGIVTQNLIPKANGEGRALALEILMMNDAVRNMIREDKIHQINSTMQTGIQQGMQTMDYDLAALVKKREITLAEAEVQAIRRDDLKRYLAMSNFR